MTNPRWGRVLLVLVRLCMCAGTMFGQAQGEDTGPPQKLRLCTKSDDCTSLTWAGDHYDGRKEGKQEVISRFWLSRWDAGRVEFSGKTAMAIANGFPLEAKFTGAIAPGGGSIAGGVDEWRVGPSASGTGTYTMTWDKASPRVDTGKLPASAQPQRRIRGILIPPGASDSFASLPEDVRAVLLAEHPLSAADAMRPCDDAKEDDKDNTGVYDPVLSLEIGKFALRRGEYLRGRCWINHSAVLNANPRAVVLLGLMFQMGWTFPKDPVKAFQYFDGGGFKARDPWAIYFMEQAFKTGNGVTKNTAKATEFDSYLMTHDDGQRLYSMIGSDDAAVVWRAARMKAIADPPTKPTSSCSSTPGTNTVTGAHTYGDHCFTSYSTDMDALQRELDQIDQQYKEDMKSSQ